MYDYKCILPLNASQIEALHAMVGRHEKRKELLEEYYLNINDTLAREPPIGMIDSAQPDPNICFFPQNQLNMYVPAIYNEWSDSKFYIKLHNSYYIEF